MKLLAGFTGLFFLASSEAIDTTGMLTFELAEYLIKEKLGFPQVKTLKISSVYQSPLYEEIDRLNKEGLLLKKDSSEPDGVYEYMTTLTDDSIQFGEVVVIPCATTLCKKDYDYKEFMPFVFDMNFLEVSEVLTDGNQAVVKFKLITDKNAYYDYLRSIDEETFDKAIYNNLKSYRMPNISKYSFEFRKWDQGWRMGSSITID